MPTPKVPALAKPNADFPNRQEFLNSLVDLENLEPASLVVFDTDPETDVPIETGSVASAEMVHVQSVQMPQEERIQMLINSADDGKLITYGRTTRMYAVTGFLVDSNLSPLQGSRAVDLLFGGHLMAKWDDYYETFFRLTACLKPRRLVRFRWRFNSFYGYLLSNIKGLESTQPSVCVVNFTFLSLYEDNGFDRQPVMKISDDIQIAGAASYESLVSLGIAAPETAEEKRVVLELTPVGRAVKDRRVVVDVRKLAT